MVAKTRISWTSPNNSPSPSGSAGNCSPHSKSTQSFFARSDTAISPVSGSAMIAA